MISPTPTGILLSIKAVPGGSRDQIIGPLGDDLKIKVAAPPEGGKANKAICALLAKTLNVPARNIQVIAGHTQPHKRIAVTGITAADAAAKLGM